MNIDEKLDLYINEIISKGEWKDKYNLIFYQSFDPSKYKKIIKQVVDLFGKLNKGKPKKTLVFDFNSKKRTELNQWDLHLLAILHQFGYHSSEGLYKTGNCLKNNKVKSIYNILKSMESRSHPQAKKRMKDQYEKRPIPEIKQQLEFIEELENYGILKNGKINFDRFLISNNTERKIVLTYDHRAIASQSTQVGWTSCMDLDKRSLEHHKIGSGVSSGVFIAYLVKPGDEYTLDSPSARVLFKPYEGIITGKLYWKADKIYGTASEDFRKTAQDIVDRVQGKVPKESDVYDLTSDTYIDDLQQTINVFEPEDEDLYKNPSSIKNIKNPTEKQQLIVVKTAPSYIEHIKNPTEKIQLAAVRDDGSVIRYIKNPSEKVQLTAVKSVGLIVRYIKNPSEKVQLEAVRKDVNEFLYIKNPSEKVQLIAVEEDVDAIEYIENPSEKVQLTAVKSIGLAIRHINKPTEKVQLEAVRNHSLAIKFIKNPTEKVQLASIEKDWFSLRFLENPSEKVLITALRIDGRAIQHIENPSEKLQLEAVRNDITALQYIIMPTEKVQLAAVRNNKLAIKYIKNPTEKVKQFMKEL
jgi:hypothetical protein